jgi:hypothetical protein
MVPGLRVASPVIGHSPPLARVAPITANVSQFTSSEQVWKVLKLVLVKVLLLGISNPVSSLNY